MRRDEVEHQNSCQKSKRSGSVTAEQLQIPKMQRCKFLPRRVSKIHVIHAYPSVTVSKLSCRSAEE
jgi:hypothetical protein